MNKHDLFKGLYAITAEKYSCGRTTLDVAQSMIDAGIMLLQYREKEKSSRTKYLECLKLRHMTKEKGVAFIVNDDVHIAMAVKADGVHIGQDDLPVQAVRSLVGTTMLIGVSTHSPQQALDAVSQGADYIGVGPLYPTKTKENVCEAVGLSYLDFVIQNIPIPHVAIGGIKRHNLSEVIRHGARCVAMVTEIVSASNIGQRIQEINHELRLL